MTSVDTDRGISAAARETEEAIGVNSGTSALHLSLYLAAEGDESAGYDFSEDARAMEAATASADKRLEVLPGDLHGIELVARSARAKALVEEFLRAR